MPRREGWDFAQLRTSFPSDPEFIRLARAAPDDLHYLAAVGLWAIALAEAWKEDDHAVGGILASFEAPGVAELLRRDLVNGGGHIRGFAKWTEEARKVREANRARQAAWRARKSPVTRDSEHVLSPLVTRTNALSHELTPVEGEVEREDSTEAPKRVGKPTPRQRLLAWLHDHGAGSPTGWAIAALNELIKVYGADAIVDCWNGAPEEVRTSRQYVQLAERVLSPAPSFRQPAKAKGLGPSAEEVANAFDS